MGKKLTRITPVVNGYAVVIAQKNDMEGTPGAYIGCFLQTPENPDDGDLILLKEAMAKYIANTRSLPLSQHLGQIFWRGNHVWPCGRL